MNQCNYISVSIIFVLVAAVNHSLEDMSCSLQDRLYCLWAGTINEDKSDVVVPGQSGARRGGCKGDKKVTVSSKNGWAPMVIAAEAKGLVKREWLKCKSEEVVFFKWIEKSWSTPSHGTQEWLHSSLITHVLKGRFHCHQCLTKSYKFTKTKYQQELVVQLLAPG